MYTQANPLTVRRLLSATSALLAMMVGQAGAATIFADGTTCTLIDAITAANRDHKIGGCRAGKGADTINLSAHAYIMDTINNNIDGGNGLPSVKSAIVINGDPDQEGKRAAIMRSGGFFNDPKFRIFHVSENGSLTLKRVVLRNGLASAEGGALYNRGKVIIVESAVLKNFAGSDEFGRAGALYNIAGGTLKIIRTSVSENGSMGCTGMLNNGNATLISSTVSGNHGGGQIAGPGGICNGGVLKLINSTISGNVGTARSSNGLDNGGSATLINSTVFGNFHGGVGNGTGSLTMINSVVANTRFGTDCLAYDPSGGIVKFLGTNLIEDGSCDVAQYGGLTGDPKMGPLLDNGGATKTHALRADSKVIDMVRRGSECQKIDQRSAQRPQGSGCDIGAFERILNAASKVRPLVRFFDEAAAQGNLVGTGRTLSGMKGGKLESTRNQILLVGAYATAALSRKACDQLKATEARIDPDRSPDRDDYVTGTAAADLLNVIESLAIDLGCR